MKKILIKDLPVGVLLIVVSLFILFPAYYLAGRPAVLEWVGILLSVLGGYKVFTIGLSLIKGVEIDASL